MELKSNNVKSSRCENKNICRTCLKLDPQSLNIYNPTNEQILKELRSFVEIEDESINQLPSHICQECLLSLKSSFLFKLKVQNIDRNLKGMLLEGIKFKEVEEETLPEIELIDQIPEDTPESENELLEEILIPEADISDEEDGDYSSDDDKDEDYTNNDDHKNTDDESSADDNRPLKQKKDRNNDDHQNTDKASTDENKPAKQKKFRRTKFFCVACDKGFKITSRFKQHNEKFHKGKIMDHISETIPNELKCETCNELFLDIISYSKHTKIHGFACSKCDKIFKLKHHLKTHEYKEHDPIECDEPQCDKKFRSKKSLSNHVRSFHNKERNHICNICNRGFYESSNLRKHISRHSTEKRVSCDVCNKAFKTTDNLRTHKKIHIPIDERKNYLCQYCGKTSLTYTGHSTHLQRHTGDKKFECLTCGKTFIAKYQLQVHIRSHTGERPFNCKMCLSNFKHSAQLKNHMLTHHSEEKNFKCSICEVSFKTRRNLNSHMSNVHLVIKKSSV